MNRPDMRAVQALDSESLHFLETCSSSWSYLEAFAKYYSTSDSGKLCILPIARQIVSQGLGQQPKTGETTVNRSIGQSSFISCLCSHVSSQLLSQSSSKLVEVSPGRQL